MSSVAQSNGREEKRLPETEILLQERTPEHNRERSGAESKREEAEDPIGVGHGFHVKHPTSYTESLLHLIKSNTGSGTFAIGEAFKNSGLVAGPLGLTIMGVICVFAQHQLIQASAVASKRLGLAVHPDYGETIQYTFEMGPRPFPRWARFAKRMVYFSILFTQLGFCSVYFLFIASNMKQVLDQYITPLDVHIYMAIVMVPILFANWVRSLKYLVPFSLFSNAVMYTGIGLTLYVCLRDGLPSVSERALVAEWSRLPLFFGTAIYCFEAIAMTMPLRNEMKNPDDFSRPLGVLNVGSAIIGLLLIFVGTISYMRYGEDIKALIPLNFDQTDILCQVIKTGICLGILLSHPIQAYVPAELIWSFVRRRYRPKRPLVAELSIRSGIVLLTFAMAESIPRLGLFISLIGSISSTFLALIFPPLLDWAGLWRQGLPLWRHAVNVITLLLGILGCVWGAYASLSEIIAAFRAGDFSVS